ncbi:hypothetical protein RTBOTA2_005234 [Rhodotorula toruloides]|nr:hypothetical protein RTBOTA2_005234 [Rhodotorula toruloides]
MLTTKPSLVDWRAINLLSVLSDPHSYSHQVRTESSRGEQHRHENGSEDGWEERSSQAEERMRLFASAAQAPYFERYKGSDGRTYLHRECIITGIGQSGRLEVARLIVREVDQLVAAGVLPEGSTALDPWNAIPLVDVLVDALHDGDFCLLLLEDELLARLTAEIMYQTLRTANDSVRPPFSLFYSRLDGRPTLVQPFFVPDFPMTYVMRYTTWEQREPLVWSGTPTEGEVVGRPGMPPFQLYCSGNALIAAMRSRVAQLEPASVAAVARTRVFAKLYTVLWSLWTSASASTALSHAQHAAHLLRTHFPSSPYIALLDTDAETFRFEDIPLPEAPEGTVDTAGVFLREARQARER